MAHLLIIEDDPELGPRLKKNLELTGYRVSLARNGHSGLESALSGIADLILLDLMLPLIDGLHILNQIRKSGSEVPVIILTAKGSNAQKLEGFRSGCDDYVTKPFYLMELIARIRAVLKRSGYQESRQVLHSNGLMVDPVTRTVEQNGKQLELLPREFDLLYELASHPAQPLSREMLVNAVWGENADVTYRTVDSHIAYLRKKLGVGDSKHQIVTVFKVGYKWDV